MSVTAEPKAHCVRVTSPVVNRSPKTALRPQLVASSLRKIRRATRSSILVRASMATCARSYVFSKMVVVGGLTCCGHQRIMLDADQDPGTDLLRYHMKYDFGRLFIVYYLIC